MSLNPSFKGKLARDILAIYEWIVGFSSPREEGVRHRITAFHLRRYQRNRVGHWVLNQIRRVGVLLLSGNRYPYGLLPLERWLAFFRKAPQDELYLVLEKDCAKEPENVSHRGSVS